MFRSKFVRFVSSGLAVAALLVTSVVTGAASEPQDDDQLPGRVARCTFVRGDVAVQETDSDDWSRLEVNAPVFEGDEVYADRTARAEIMLGADRFVRFGDGADVTFSQLDEDRVHVAMTSGTLSLSLQRFGDEDRFEISAPAAVVHPREHGVYRIDIGDNGGTWITIRHGAAEVRTVRGTFDVDAGDLVRIANDDSSEIAVSRGGARGYRDNWDEWTDQRDEHFASYERGPYPSEIRPLYGRSDVYGIAELALFGTWFLLDGQRWVWRPRAVGASWAPYRDGYWRYTPAFGWIWVSSEPWGWAPYHFGRWDYTPSYGWVWLPYDNYPTRGDWWRTRYRWRPALVYVWRHGPGDGFAWVPLAPGEPFVRFSTARREAPRPRVTAFSPRFVKENRGVTAITKNDLDRQVKPRVLPVQLEQTVKAPPPGAAEVVLPVPSRTVPPAKKLPATKAPAEKIRNRAVVVDPQSLPPVTTKPAPKVMKQTRKADPNKIDPAKIEVQGQERARQLEQRPAPGKAREGKTITVQPAPKTKAVKPPKKPVKSKP